MVSPGLALQGASAAAVAFLPRATCHTPRRPVRQWRTALPRGRGAAGATAAALPRLQERQDHTLAAGNDAADLTSAAAGVGLDPGELYDLVLTTFLKIKLLIDLLVPQIHHSMV